MDEPVPLYASAYAGYGIREQVRQLTYGDDVGQSGWVTADELDRFAEWLGLDADSRLLDVGCGSGGPALRLAERTGAGVLGVDLLEGASQPRRDSPRNAASRIERASSGPMPEARFHSQRGPSTASSRST